MYSRTRTVHSEQRYATNIPPIYGGSRFYQHAADAAAPEVFAEDVRAAGAAGIPVQYEAPPKQPPLAEDAFDGETAAEISAPPETDDGCVQCGAAEEQENCESREGDCKKTGGLLSSVLDDPEELLLLGILFLLCCENDRALDVIVILLLLLIVR